MPGLVRQVFDGIFVWGALLVSVIPIFVLVYAVFDRVDVSSCCQSNGTVPGLCLLLEEQATVLVRTGSFSTMTALVVGNVGLLVLWGVFLALWGFPSLRRRLHRYTGVLYAAVAVVLTVHVFGLGLAALSVQLLDLLACHGTTVWDHYLATNVSLAGTAFNSVFSLFVLLYRYAWTPASTPQSTVKHSQLNATELSSLTTVNSDEEEEDVMTAVSIE